MTQEDKMLLIKDLSSRLPYAVHVQHTSGFSGTLHDITIYHKYDEHDNIYDAICYTDFFGEDDSITIEHFKPYLYPLSSMTEEERKELQKITNNKFYAHFNYITNFKSSLDGEWHASDNCFITNAVCNKLISWLDEKHFDHRSDEEGKTLIEKGLAIDATGLNIY